MKRLFSSLLIGLVMMMVGAGVVQADTIHWDKKGTIDGFCKDLRLNPNLEPGTQEWQFNLTNSIEDISFLSAEFQNSSDSVENKEHDELDGPVAKWFVTTSTGAKLVSANAREGKSNSQLTVSHCYYNPILPLDVSKTAETSYTRTYKWDILKSVGRDVITLDSENLPDILEANYLLKIFADFEEHDYAVSGTITIKNPNPGHDALINSISDELKIDDSPYPVELTDCMEDDNVIPLPSVEKPYLLEAGKTLECDYTRDLDGKVAGVNHVVVVTAEASDVPGGNAEKEFDFVATEPKEIDKCVDIYDDKVNLENPELCFDPEEFDNNEGDESTLRYVYHKEYSLDLLTLVDGDLQCGATEFTNTAEVRRLLEDLEEYDMEEHLIASDSATVLVTLECPVACTLTQGYWKTHSLYGPASSDEVWDSLASGADTSFFQSGKTYYKVLWTAPGGNVYYVLAHQYIAAELNMLAKASMPGEVQGAFDAAYELLMDSDPDKVAELKGQARNHWTSLAKTLDDYNNGLIGPGHCGDEQIAPSTTVEGPVLQTTLLQPPAVQTEDSGQKFPWELQFAKDVNPPAMTLFSDPRQVLPALANSNANSAKGKAK